MMKDLVLEWEGGEGYKQDIQVILPNIQGQRYPGEREGEEFVFCRNDKIRVDSTHSTITVDEQGQYWIQCDTTKFKTFVNLKRLLEPHLLGIGDTVFLEDSEIRYGYPRRRHLFFHVKERIVPGSVEIEGGGNEACKTMKELDVVVGADESPLDNSLILDKIMSYLPVKDLKNARLVCKKWKPEATKSLEKKGMGSFTFNYDYLDPQNSTRVFRYLHEMGDMKIRNLRIDLSLWFDQSEHTGPIYPQEPGQKMIDDLRKLLKSSHNFSSLFLETDFEKESGFLSFSTVLQELGEKLVELKLETYNLFIPVILSPLPPMRNLKKYTHCGLFKDDNDEQKWVSHFVPLFSNGLEHFTSDGHTADPYLQEFLNHPMPKLKGLAFKDGTCPWTISTLLELESPLTFLEIQYCDGCSEEPEYEELLERLLLKHSTSLKHLVIRIGTDDFLLDKEFAQVSFPSFQSLEVLELAYGRRARVDWEADLDYGKHFPSLRKLTVRPPKPWSEDDPVFNAFFPEKGELRCQTVEELWIPVLPNPNPMLPQRMDQIKKMFPSAGIINFFQ